MIEPASVLATKDMPIDALKAFEGTMIFVSRGGGFLHGLSNPVLDLAAKRARGPHQWSVRARTSNTRDHA